MILNKICCCFIKKDDNLSLEKRPSGTETAGNKQNQIPSISVAITPDSIEPEDKNKPNFSHPTDKVIKNEQPITEQPKISLKVKITDKDLELKAKQPALEILERNKYTNNDISKNERPFSDTEAYVLKKKYQEYNNFAFVDEIDAYHNQKIETIIENDDKIVINKIENVNRTSIIINNGTIKKETIEYESESENENGEITPPLESEVDFEDLRTLMIEKSVENFIENINKKPTPAPRITTKKTEDEIDHRNQQEIPNRSSTVNAGNVDVYKSIRLSCLEAHNRLRALHGCPPLKENEELNNLTENWANHLIKNGCQLIHRPNNKFGENLFWTNDRNGHVTMAVQAWYDEIKLYDFNNPGFSKETGHFTQLLWRDTYELGTAVVKQNSNMIVVCNYNPPGNYKGDFNDYTVPRLIAENFLTNEIIQDFIEKIRESSLLTHNRIRALHGCPPLQRSEELDRVAEVTLDYCEENNGKIPQLTPGFGRNCFWSPGPFTHVTQAINFWYEEGVQLYNYDFPTTENNVGGFIQLIWRDTLELGTDIRRIGKDIWVVCLYNPSRRSPELFNDYNIPRPIADKLHLPLEKYPEQMRMSCLDAHNRLRSLHGCPPLLQNSDLDAMAEEWAKTMASVNKLSHRPNSEYGENLYWTSDKLGHVTMAVQSWYNEVEKYDFNNPDFNPKTGHFTQLIWRDCVELGTGIARRGDTLYIVCLYNPGGNYSGRFNDYYVPRPISY